MKALILNSGLGSRMGSLTREHPKCMSSIGVEETILSRQLKLLRESNISEVIITTGYYDDVLREYCDSLGLGLNISFVKNSLFESTNYIYSIYCAKDLLDDDLILMHGDLVFERKVLNDVISFEHSCMVTSSSVEIPQKDFKARISNGNITYVGVDCFDDVVAAQPLYKLLKDDWTLWLEKIIRFCEAGQTNVYAENALNELNGSANIYALDIEDDFCMEIDTPEDLKKATSSLENVNRPTVYMSISSDIIHSGHLRLINNARKLGRLIVGVLSDEAVASYKRYPLVPASERKALIENIAGVYKVVDQVELSYKHNLEKYRPSIVVHGDDWCEGFQRPIRDEVISILKSYGGELIEFPYSSDKTYEDIDSRARTDLSMPDYRRGRLKKVLNLKGLITAMEAHDGLTGLIVEKTVVHQNGGACQFDAMWISSLCDSTAKGKPDIELVDMTSRFRTIEDITEVTTKPIIFDGDTGGRTEHFVYTVRSLERLGVSMVIIEDKTGLKKNSLFGTEVEQVQDSIENFCYKIRSGKKAQRTADFMICARIESLILERGMDDALKRAFSYVEAGADAIMIHSRQKDPFEIKQFLQEFRKVNSMTPIVLVPTSYNSITEDEWKQLGANIIIYANQLMRAEVPAIQKTAEIILQNHRAKECDSFLMPFNDIIRLIPSDL